MPDAILQLERIQRGDTLMLVVILLPVLFIVLSLGVDLAGVIQMKTTQEEALGAVREAAMSPNVALVADTEDNPGQCIAREITNSLRDFGYCDAVEVYFYELPEDVTPPFDSPPRTRRIYTYEVVLRGTFQPTFAVAMGIDDVSVKTAFVTCSMPYTDTAPYIWRPSWSASNQGCWTTVEGQDFILATFEPLTREKMPVGLQDQLNKVVDEQIT